MSAKTWKKERFKQRYDFLSFTATLDDRGRILIPASVRKRLRIKSGSLVIATISPNYRFHLDGEKDV